jgi:NAD(P)-dependent dehydrogenase (short-subunit alcohol dehydrogenase family)
VSECSTTFADRHAVVTGASRGIGAAIALEYATKNITVNAICPGYTDTAIVEKTIANIMSKTGRSENEALAALVAANPQRRLIRPEEVAHAVLWLCRPGTESVTGQSIVIAGGEVT